MLVPARHGFPTQQWHARASIHRPIRITHVRCAEILALILSNVLFVTFTFAAHVGMPTTTYGIGMHILFTIIVSSAGPGMFHAEKAHSHFRNLEGWH